MLEVVIWACLIGALLLFGYSAYALRREMDAQEAAKNVVEKVADKVVPPATATEGASGLSTATCQQSLLGADKVIKAFADLGDSLSKLPASIAALFDRVRPHRTRQNICRRGRQSVRHRHLCSADHHIAALRCRFGPFRHGVNAAAGMHGFDTCPARRLLLHTRRGSSMLVTPLVSAHAAAEVVLARVGRI